MKMIQFPTKITIAACEKFMVTIASDKNDTPLLLPAMVKYYAFGGLASAIQAINTWARNSKGRELLLRSNTSKDRVANEEALIREVIKRPYKFAAAMFAHSISTQDAHEEDLRGKIYKAASEAIDEQTSSRYGQQRGGLCWFDFIDHSTKGFDRHFYIKNPNSIPEPRQLSAFTTAITDMINKVMSVSGGAKPFKNIEFLARVFYELFMNTHEHGSRSKNRNDWLKPGVRITYIQSTNLSEDGVQGITESNEQIILSKYIELVKNSSSSSSSNRNRFIEIGIIDSGLGYYDRWKNDCPESYDVNLSEYQIFKKCFTFRQTSTHNRNKGHGLPAVMAKLTELKGLMRIRSGRLSLYRNFIEAPYLPSDTCDFFDWSSAQPAKENLTTMEPVSGVGVTLLIPLEAKQ